MNDIVISIDFDGTLVDNKWPDVGEFRDGAIEAVKTLHSAGFVLILNTCRRGLPLVDARDALINAGIFECFHRINENAECLVKQFGDCRKIAASFYIDDRNIGGIPPWPEIVKIVMEKFPRD